MLVLRLQSWLLVFSVLFLAIGFLEPGTTDETAFAGTAGEKRAFHTVAKGYQSGVREPLEAIVRNQNDWSELWGKHTSAEASPPLLPVIDFDKELVVAVFLGHKPTGGHEVEIVSAEKANEGLLVFFVERQPKPGSVVTQAFTQPFHIVRISAQGSGTVTFRRLS
jgi:hypothetical protein